MQEEEASENEKTVETYQESVPIDEFIVKTDQQIDETNAGDFSNGELLNIGEKMPFR